MTNAPSSVPPRSLPELEASEIGDVVRQLHSYAVLYARRMAQGDGDGLKEDSDKRRQHVAEKIIAVVERRLPEHRAQAAFVLMEEVRKSWAESIADGMRQFPVQQTPQKLAMASRGLDRVNGAIMAHLMNEAGAAAKAQKDVDDARSGVHHELVGGAGI